MSLLYIANWKMQLRFDQELNLAHDYCSLSSNINHNKAQLVICPSFPALDSIKKIIKSNAILSLGAQNCSEHRYGPYTGQVCAQSLADIGCTYCIVGHSERRQIESNQQIAQKTIQLLINNITPILCIGERDNRYNKSHILTIIENQLKSVLETIKQHPVSPDKLCIAYEPSWSIGTGMIPEQGYLTDVFYHFQHICSTYISGLQPTLLYGGSVTEKHIATLKTNPLIEGFLIGGASLDIKKIKNIVSLA